MKEINLDELIPQALKARELPITTPIEEIEQNIFERVRLNKEKRRKKSLLFIKVAAVVIVALGISISLFPAQSAVAFKAKLKQTIRYIGDRIHAIQSSDIPNNPSEEDRLNERIAAMQAEVDFPIKKPDYIPAGFILDNIKKGSNDKKPQVSFTYNNGNAMIIINQSKLTGSHTNTININAGQGKVENIEIGRFDGYLITFNNGTCNLIWESDYGVEYGIFGNLTPEQAKEIAKSMI